MKINIWTLACLLMGLTACTDSSDELVQKGNEITLKLINHEMSRSAGVPNLNENLIKNADIFFFAYDANGNPTDNCVLHHKETDIEEQTSYDFTLSATKFVDKTKYYIYAIANLKITEDYTGKNVSIENYLKKLEATSIIIRTGENGKNGIQDHFVMDGFNNTFTYTKGMTGTTEIPLTRSAAKITLTVNVANTVESGGATYTPSKGSMTAQLFKGEANGVVNGFTTSTATLVTGAYSLDKTTDDNKQTHSVPFYSYPIDWGTDEEKACFLELMIPWTSLNGTVNYYYYHIPIEKDVKGNSITSLERNHHYIINVDVTILGSLKEENEKTVTLNPKFLVKEWNTVALDADLKNYRYLWVQEPANGEYWVMNNTTTLEIPYASSHDCERTIVSCTQKSLYSADYDEEWGNNDFSSTNINANFYCALLDGKIVYKHNLDNNYTSTDFDFTPYDIIITIKHVNDQNNIDDELSETIIIKQYPAIYAEADENSDYNNDDNKNGNNGYVFVNGYQQRYDTDDLDVDFFLSATGIKGLETTDYSPNMYTFTVTSVDGTEYIIGDPREKNYTYDDTDAVWAESDALHDGNSNRELKYYYGTDSSIKTRNMISPKFRLASAYGVLYTVTDVTNGSDKLESLKKRCASYQEDGYPAGRWRLPTEAEFKFILMQVNRNPAYLPPMYIKSHNYWCAHGLGQVDGNGNVTMNYVTEAFYYDNRGTKTGYSTRCVYDEWYWGSDPALTEKSTFTWGDEPITR